MVAMLDQRTEALFTSERADQPAMVSVQLERWLQSDGEQTVGSLVKLFREKSFAILFVLLLGVPALPLPTGGATHVFELMPSCSPPS
jgi:hypothetical protein